MRVFPEGRLSILSPIIFINTIVWHAAAREHLGFVSFGFSMTYLLVIYYLNALLV